MSLDLENLTTDEQTFRDAIAEAGAPTTAAELKAAWQASVDSADITITNTSDYSPFWCLVTSLVTTPVLWLVALIVRVIMPNCFAKTATGSFLDIIADAYGVTRKAASTASGTLVFTRIDSDGELAVPVGTTVRTVTINGTVYRLTTTQAATFFDGQLFVTVPAQAEASGAAYNLGEGYYSIIESYLPGVTATNPADWLSTPGADQETDEALRLRVRNQFSAAGDWHTDAKYTAMIAEYAAISVDRIYFDHDTPRGPGSADAYILYDAAAVPDEQITAINTYITDGGNHGHGDDLLAKALPETTHDVDLAVYFDSATTDTRKAAILAEAELIVGCAFRENSDYTDHVTQVFPEARNSMSLLCAELHAYFPEVSSVVTDAEDIVSELTIPRLGTLTIAEGA
jgi:uncharacterized phage protein gp47/JayE